VVLEGSWCAATPVDGVVRQSHRTQLRRRCKHKITRHQASLGVLPRPYVRLRACQNWQPHYVTGACALSSRLRYAAAAAQEEPDGSRKEKKQLRQAASVGMGLARPSPSAQQRSAPTTNWWQRQRLPVDRELRPLLIICRA
jgi:hypothetical protein